MRKKMPYRKKDQSEYIEIRLPSYLMPNVTHVFSFLCTVILNGVLKQDYIPHHFYIDKNLQILARKYFTLAMQSLLILNSRPIMSVRSKKASLNIRCLCEFSLSEYQVSIF